MDLLQGIGAILEDAGNHMLRMDAETLAALGELDGRVFCLRINRAGKGEEGPALYLFPSAGGFRIESRHEGEADVTLVGNPPAFVKLLLADNTPAALGAGHMQISGDMDLGQRFQRILKRLDIDWEEQLAQRVGDIAAHKLGYGARRLREWGRHVVGTLRQDAVEILQEESRITPPRERIERFLSAVDELRSDVERMEKRLQRLGRNTAG